MSKLILAAHYKVLRDDDIRHVFICANTRGCSQHGIEVSFQIPLMDIPTCPECKGALSYSHTVMITQLEMNRVIQKGGKRTGK